MDVFIQQLINALALGGTYALLALGLAMVFSVLGLINFAHGELMTITGYGIFFALGAGVPYVPALIIGILLATGSAVLMERIAKITSVARHSQAIEPVEQPNKVQSALEQLSSRVRTRGVAA